MHNESVNLCEILVFHPTSLKLSEYNINCVQRSQFQNTLKEFWHIMLRLLGICYGIFQTVGQISVVAAGFKH